VSLFRRRRRLIPEARNRQIVGLTGQTVFILAPDHPLRAAPCLICRAPVGGHQVIVTGVVALAAAVCPCGMLPGGQYLIHAGHLPLLPGELPAAVARLGPHECDEAPELVP
jgi:hypothetical protein